MPLSAMSPHLLSTSRDGDSTTSLGKHIQCEQSFLWLSGRIQSKPSVAQLEAIASCPIVCHLRKRGQAQNVMHQMDFLHW